MLLDSCSACDANTIQSHMQGVCKESFYLNINWEGMCVCVLSYQSGFEVNCLHACLYSQTLAVSDWVIGMYYTYTRHHMQHANPVHLFSRKDWYTEDQCMMHGHGYKRSTWVACMFLLTNSNMSSAWLCGIGRSWLHCARLRQRTWIDACTCCVDCYKAQAVQHVSCDK